MSGTTTPPADGPGCLHSLAGLLLGALFGALIGGAIAFGIASYRFDSDVQASRLAVEDRREQRQQQQQDRPEPRSLEEVGDDIVVSVGQGGADGLATLAEASFLFSLRLAAGLIAGAIGGGVLGLILGRTYFRPRPEPGPPTG